MQTENKKAPDIVTITKPQYETGKTLKTKEDYLGKLLQGVEVLQTVKHMNDVENEIIDEFINSLFEEMKPEEQKKKEEQEKKEEEEKEEPQEKEPEPKKAEESGEASNKKPSTKQEQGEEGQEKTQSSTSPKKLTEQQESTTSPSKEKIEEAMEKIKALKEAMKANGIKAQPVDAGKNTEGQAGKKEEVTAGGLNESKDDGLTKPEKNDKAGDLNYIQGYEGGEAQGRNKSVKKSDSGRLYAGAKRG